MTDPIHAALKRLIARLPASDPNGPVPAWSDSFYAACAALSADGPAVPEGREPASVVGEPSSFQCEAWLENYHPTITPLFASPAALAQPEPAGEATDEELLRAYGLAKRDHCYEGPIDDWPKRAERAATVAGIRAAIALDRSRQPAPPAEALAEALAARPLLERVAAMGNCIGQHTVGEIMAISGRAAAWLAANPPGQPVAIEPRGCPTPGACSCVQPAPPAEGEVAELVAWLRTYASGEFGPSSDHPDAGMLTRAADLLEQRRPAPVPVSERPWERDGWCDEAGRCWFGAPQDGAADAGWILRKPSERLSHQTVSLPARALPLPAGEVQT
jgi:hypothetical protein